jgi:LuxR family maltose regulon positive regulatory protein
MEFKEIQLTATSSTNTDGGKAKHILKARTLSKQSMLKRQPPIHSDTTQWQLILEKVVVPSPTGCLRRPRLAAMLDQSLRSCTSTIISGRAGSGKTTLAIDFAENSRRSVAWYKVDAPDSQLQIFFKYLISSIRSQRPGFGNYALCSLVQSEPDINQIAQLAEVFVYELELQSAKPLLIVIEDLHLVCDADWLVPFFRRLLPLLPADVHMLITSRTMPPAPFWRMRSKQTLSVIDEEMLSFTRDEAYRLFEQYGLNRDQASIALDHARGRAAALSNLAATLHFAESETFSGENMSCRLRVG